MKKLLIHAVVVPVFLCIANTESAYGFGGSDNFNDNSRDPLKWGEDLDFGNGSGTITETNGRLDFSSSTTDYSYLARPWITGVVTYGTNWEVQLDTVVPADSGAGAFVGFGIEISNANDQTAYLGIEHDNDGQAPQYSSYAVPPMFNDPITEISSDSMTTGAVRIRYNGRLKVFTTYYDSDGPANGYQWKFLSSFGINGANGTTGNVDWGMNGSDPFDVSVFGISSGVAVPKGLTYGDNFLATLATPPGTQSLKGSDDFNDNVKDPAKWSADEDFGLGTTVLQESSGRINFSSSSTDYSYLARPWNKQVGTYAADWEVQLDTVVPADSGTGAFLGFGVEIWNNNDIKSFVGIDHDNDGQSPEYFSYCNSTAGNAEPASSRSATTSGAIRMTFNSQTKVLSTFFDSTGPSNGYQWTLLSSYGIAGSGGATGNLNWGMNDGDTFTITVIGISSGVIATSGLTYGDNFSTTSPGLSSNAAFNAAKSGSITVPTVIGKTYRLRRTTTLQGSSIVSEQAGTGGDMSFPFDDSGKTDPKAFFLIEEAP